MFIFKCSVAFSAPPKEWNTTNNFHGKLVSFCVGYTWFVCALIESLVSLCFLIHLRVFNISRCTCCFPWNICNNEWNVPPPRSPAQVRTTNDRYQFHWLNSDPTWLLLFSCIVSDLIQLYCLIQLWFIWIGWNIFHSKRVQTHKHTRSLCFAIIFSIQNRMEFYDL